MKSHEASELAAARELLRRAAGRFADLLECPGSGSSKLYHLLEDIAEFMARDAGPSLPPSPGYGFSLDEEEAALREIRRASSSDSQSNPAAALGGSSERQDRSSGVRLSGPGPLSSDTGANQ